MPPSAPEHVARVLVDVGLPHLDRPFDYAVTDEQVDLAVPGVRVRVRFAGRTVGGYVLERARHSDADRELAAIVRVVSPEPVLTPAVAELAGRVADHYAGTRSDVLRLAIPPRHARTEAATSRLGPVVPPSRPDPGPWSEYPRGRALVESLADGSCPRAVVTLTPGTDWADMMAGAAQATASSGRGVLVVAPDVRDVARLDTLLTDRLGPASHVALHGEQGASARYRRFLAVLRDQVRVVVGTRSAVYAPVSNLGLIMVLDDGDDVLAEARAPYPHARDVALIRAHQEECGLMLVGTGRTAEAARLVRTGWAHEVRAPRAVVRSRAPAVEVVDPHSDDRGPGGRVPAGVFRAVRAGLAHGPVLVQVARHGYRPALACQRCRTAARCPDCRGPLRQDAPQSAPVCGWCGRSCTGWRCPRCGAQRLRARAVGEERTAEELGRAFPGVPVRRSGLGHVLTGVSGEPALVVATPGAEPRAPSGYAAAVLLDGDAMLGRADLRVGEETLRRWLNACSSVRARADGGVVVLVATPSHPACQALVRWDPVGFADRELDDRTATRLPPSWRLAELVGDPEAVADLRARSDLPAGTEVLGPVAQRDTEAVRLIARCPLPDGVALARALRAGAGVRSARRAPGTVRIRIDPVDLA